jgi:peptidoglycan/xylan/chitin deacetylase (PgdA/CDA1 family)
MEGGSPEQAEYQMPLDEFKWQMQYLRDNGFTPISARQLSDFWFQGKPLPPKPVLLTFDDGFRSVYEYAFPVVKRFGYPSIFFLYTGFLENEERALDRGKARKVDPDREALHPDDILEMERTGMDLESHTTHHYNMGSMGDKKTGRSYAQLLESELDEPLTYIQDKYGHRPTMIAYPYGVYSPQILAQTSRSGYGLAFTVNPGPNDHTVNPLKLRRNLVLYPISHRKFAQMFEDQVLHLEGLSPGDGQEIATDKPLVTARVLDDIDPKSLRFTSGDIRMRIAYDPSTRTFRHQFQQPLKGLGHMMTLSATGLDGKSRVYTWYFRIKRRPAGMEGDGK